MQDEQNLERVILEFEKFNIPAYNHACRDGYLKVDIYIDVLITDTRTCSIIQRFITTAKKKIIHTKRSITNSAEKIYRNE